MGCCQTREAKGNILENERLSYQGLRPEPWPFAKENLYRKSDDEEGKSKHSDADTTISIKKDENVIENPQVPEEIGSIVKSLEEIKNVEDSLLDLKTHPFPGQEFIEVYRELPELCGENKWVPLVEDCNLEIFKRISSDFNRDCVVLKARILFNNTVSLNSIVETFHTPMLYKNWDDSYIDAEIISGTLFMDWVVLSRRDHKNIQRNYSDKWSTRKDKNTIITIVRGEELVENVAEAGKTVFQVILIRKIDLGILVTLIQQIDCRPIMKMPANTLMIERFKKTTSNVLALLESRINEW